jgi:hypothetical protein
MTIDSSGVFLEFYDDEVELVEVSDTEYLEIYDGSFGTPTAVAGENLPFTHSGPLEVGVGTVGYPIKGGTFTILTIAARLSSAPTGSSAIVDVNKNGTTIFGNQAFRPTFAAASRDAIVGTHTVSSLTDGDILTIDVDQVGSTLPGSYLTLVIRLQRIA